MNHNSFSERRALFGLKSGQALKKQFLSCMIAGIFLISPAGCRDSSDKAGGGRLEILNVSYDPTREFYREINESFASHWLDKKGESITIRQSHGGSASQARAVIDGLDADIVTLALAYDVDAIAKHSGRIALNWQERLPENSAPYTSTIVFLVREGNPKNIRTWSDLAREGISVITPNPKTSGVARLNYLAMWGYSMRQSLGKDYLQKISDPAFSTEIEEAEQKAMNFVSDIFRNVPILDRGARGATGTFIQRGIGDVLVNWENEANLGIRERAGLNLEIVVPPFSILAEPVVALVDANVERKNTGDAAEAYLQFLYSDIAQAAAARHFFRPRNTLFLEKAGFSREIEMFTVEELFGNWQEAHSRHFADGANFDRIYSHR